MQVSPEFILQLDGAGGEIRDCLPEFFRFLRTYEQPLTTLECKLHASVTACVVCLAISEAAPDPPATVFPDGLILPGVILSQILGGKSLGMNMEWSKTNI